MHQNHSRKNCMKGFAEVTQGEDLYLTGPLLKGTGDLACKKRHKNISGNVISVRDSRQTFISLEEFSILSPAFGLLLNEDWIL